MDKNPCDCFGGALATDPPSIVDRGRVLITQDSTLRGIDGVFYSISDLVQSSFCFRLVKEFAGRAVPVATDATGDGGGTSNPTQATHSFFLAFLCPVLLVLFDEQKWKVNIIHFNTCIAACAYADWASSLELWTLAEVSGIKPDSWSLNAFMAAQTNWTFALAAVARANDPVGCCDVISQNILMSTTSWNCALDVFHGLQMSLFQADVFSFSSCIKAASKLSWQVVFRFLEAAVELPLDVIVLNSALSAFGNAGQWQVSLETLRLYPSLEPDVVSFNACLNACENGKVSSAALDLLEHMEILNISPSIVSMNSAISACEKTTAWQTALGLLADLPGYALLPDPITYNASISACAAGYKWQHAALLFYTMEVSSLSDEISFAALIAACSNASQLNSSMKLLQCLESHRSLKPSRLIYNSCLHACEKVGNWKLALHLLRLISKGQISADLLGYTSIIRACQLASKWQQISYLLEQMQDERIHLDSFCLDAAVASATLAGHSFNVARLLGSLSQDMLK